MICPCCGSTLNEPVELRSLSYARMGPTARAVIRVLTKAYPIELSGPDLISQVYGNTEPEYSANAIGEAIRQLRPHIEKMGWTIPRAKPHGGYKLERLK